MSCCLYLYHNHSQLCSLLYNVWLLSFIQGLQPYMLLLYQFSLWFFPHVNSFYSCMGFSPGLSRVSADVNQLLYVIVSLWPPASFSCRVSFSAFYKLPYTYLCHLCLLCVISMVLLSLYLPAMLHSYISQHASQIERECTSLAVFIEKAPA